ncbi:MAG: UbiA family prenyltransferase [Desulfobacterales bacterium]|nr:UbiA family prenyltransferase [Desulfobacterales bacterium]
MLKKILRFIKIEHTAFSLPLIFTGAWMGAGHVWPTPGVLIGIIIAAVGARTFGMACNRIFDRRIDARNPRTAGRELPSGAMGVDTALAVALGGLVVYLTACALLNRWCLILSPVPLVPLLGYSLLKRFTALCHFGIGLCLALAPLGAFVAAAGHVDLTAEVLIFSAYVFFWLSGADIIYALLDIESDRRTGIHSIPAALGAQKAQVISGLCHLISLAALALLLHQTRAEWPALFSLGVTLLLFVAMYLPQIPIMKRFFPISTLAGVAGAITPLLA